MQPHMPMSHHVVNNLIVKKMSCISILFFLNNYIVQDYSVLNNSVRPVIYEIIIQ